MHRQINHPLRDDTAVAHDDHRIRADLSELSAKFRVLLDPGRLQNTEAQASRRLFHRRAVQFHATSAGPIGLGDDQGYVESGVDQLLKRRDGESRSSCKNEIHSYGQSLEGGWVDGPQRGRLATK